MILEHLLYTGTLAVITGLVLSTARIADERPHLILLLVAGLVPDSAWVLSEAVTPGWASSFQFLAAAQGGLHTLGALAVFTLLTTIALRPFSLRSQYAALCCALGYGSHLLADGLTHTTRYFLLWPLSPEHVRIGLFVPYTPDILGIAETRVLAVGLILFALTIAARTAMQGTSWMRDLVSSVRSREERRTGDGKGR